MLQLVRWGARRRRLLLLGEITQLIQNWIKLAIEHNNNNVQETLTDADLNEKAKGEPKYQASTTLHKFLENQNHDRMTFVWCRLKLCDPDREGVERTCVVSREDYCKLC